MSHNQQFGLLLRFRDLVTEPGGNIAEHQRILRQYGYVWWGWWARQRERVPREVFGKLFPSGTSRVKTVLFDSGLNQLYETTATGIVVAPSHVGVNSPNFETTPDYYVRGRYPAWFRFEEDILPFNATSIAVAARPTLDPKQDDFEVRPAENVNLEPLRNEIPTLWIIRLS